MSRFDLSSSALPDSAHVIGFRGREGISELYAFEIHLTIPDGDCADLDLDACIGARATLEVAPDDRADSSSRSRYHGILSSVELVHALDGKALLEVTLVPALARLAVGRHSRMFTGQSLPDILSAVLGDAALDCTHELQLSAEHPTEAHVCQYRESDYDFLARWMQREGMYFFFDHQGDDAEKLVICDDRAVHQSCRSDPVRFRPVSGGDTSGGEALHSFRASHPTLPASVTLRDYDHTRPALDVSGQARVSQVGQGEIIEHEVRFFDPSDGARLAALRAEEHAARAGAFEGQGAVFGLRPGGTFDLEEHVRSDVNQTYLVTELHHVGVQSLESEELRALLGYEQPDGYSIRVGAVPHALQYRSPATVPWPRVHGHQLAVVDGPADSDYAQLDEHGCYVVKLMFDESDLEGDRASTRIRMMQPHAGAPEGWHFPLRKGTEVVIVFQGGDPDRPVIAGAVPNALNPSPVTSDNNTQNVLQTGGLTRLEVEDEAGKQYIWLHTPPADTYLNLGYPELATHNITLHSEKNCFYRIGSDQLIEVGGVLDEQVTGDVSETYSSDQSSTIHGPQHTTVDKAVSEIYLSSQTTTVNQQPRSEKFQNGQSTLVVGKRGETYNTAQTQHVLGTTDETWIGGWMRTVGKTSELTDGDLQEMIAGSAIEFHSPGVDEKYGDTTAVWASLLWLGPSITLVTPEYHITAPLKIDLDAHWEGFHPFHHNDKPTSTGSVLAKIGVTVTSRGATAFKYEAVGASIGIKGPVVERGILKCDMTALIVALAGVEEVE